MYTIAAIKRFPAGGMMQSIWDYVLFCGGLFFVFGLLRVHFIKRVHADRGSVSVGGDNHGHITIVRNQRQNSEPTTLFWTIWNVVTGFATLIGLAITFWPIK